MFIRRLQIKGAGTESFTQLLLDCFKHKHIVAESEVTVFTTEKHYFRSNGLIMTTVVSTQLANHKYELQIISGGGGSGLWNLEWNVEKKRTEEIADLVAELCQRYGWQIKNLGYKSIEEFE